MTQFTDLGLTKAILRAVSDEGYTNPTPIQAQVIPAMLAGKDVLGTAQTGTGKTASFVLPLLHRIVDEKLRPREKSCGALILVPTRELAAQVVDNIRNYGRHMKHSVAMVIGGAKAGPQIQAMKRGVDILVATPGRLEDLVSTGDIRLDATQTVILDEADQMLDFGFVPAIRRILKKIPAARQTALLSATMPPAIRSLADDFLNQPEEISVAKVSKPIEKIQQKVIYSAKTAKRNLLVEVLNAEDIDRAVVFTRTKHGANKVTQHLDKAGLSAAAIHGNKSQNQRQLALAGFRSGKIKILVATDIAARGIDVDGVSHVVNFELPNVPEVYVHRIGRTARAGKSGIAISLVEETEIPYLRDIQKLIGEKIEAANDPVVSGEANDNSAAEPSRNTPNQRNQRNRGRGRGRGKPSADKAQGDKPQQAQSKSRPAKGPKRPASKKPASRKQGGRRTGDDSAKAGLNRMFANIGTKG
ncbi:DEAD/DEAH box helicase [Aestuariispira ectoiniformans]|uniref:DEAD/DEAH box helicase n=1 Tax=Aestuariispira ectoiniformans TaxID=2775080 RepID=UPI00223BBA42|nr:DEAD/DEAH box helicase [Aestuariispira ectoiniformans]